MGVELNFPQDLVPDIVYLLCKRGALISQPTNRSRELRFCAFSSVFIFCHVFHVCTEFVFQLLFHICAFLANNLATETMVTLIT